MDKIKELFHYLDYIGALNKFMHYVLKMHSDRDFLIDKLSKSTPIMELFFWRKTNEGFDYWFAINEIYYEVLYNKSFSNLNKPTISATLKELKINNDELYYKIANYINYAMKKVRQTNRTIISQ